MGQNSARSRQGTVRRRDRSQFASLFPFVLIEWLFDFGVNYLARIFLFCIRGTPPDGSCTAPAASRDTLASISCGSESCAPGGLVNDNTSRE